MQKTRQGVWCGGGCKELSKGKKQGIPQPRSLVGTAAAEEGVTIRNRSSTKERPIHQSSIANLHLEPDRLGGFIAYSGFNWFAGLRARRITVNHCCRKGSVRLLAGWIH